MSSPITGHPLVGRAYPYIFTASTGTPTFTITANEYDTAVYTGSVAATLSLPALSTLPPYFKLYVRNNASGAVALTVAGNGTDNIGAANTATLTQNQSINIMSDVRNSKWQILFGPA